MARTKHAKASVGEDITELLSPSDMADVLTRRQTDSLPSGAELGPYLIEGVLGEGGGGIVYRAQHKQLGTRVAVKVLRSEMAAHPTMLTRFVREAEAINKIGHPGIVQIYEFGNTPEGRPYYAMELLEGVDLRKLLKAHGRFTAAEVLELMEPVCAAVQAAHDAGFIHRDIKANNIAISERDGKRVVKLLDFGIAKLMHGESSVQGLTEPGAMLGSPHSMAPEQIRAEPLDARADVYALGVLIFQLLTAQYPFYALEPGQVALMHLQSPAPRPSSLAPVSTELDSIVLRCLEKRRERRFASVSELLEALRRAVAEGPSVEVAGDSSSAVGVYFELTADGAEELTDEMIEDMGNALDTIEQELMRQGFVLPLRTSNALLGVRRIENDTSPQRDREQAELTVAELCGLVEERENRHPAIRLISSLTIGQAFYRGSGDSAEVVGGSLLELETWTNPGRRAAS